jgi:hypothetical protein
MRPIEDYGNKLTIIGMVVGDGEETQIVIFPDEKTQTEVETIFPTQEELLQIFNQLDTLKITSSQKVVLRKSQRHIDQNISWQVFRRDGFKCVYCAEEQKALTVDHLVLWEELGDSVPDNLVTSCKKCNHTRGSQQLPEFLKSDYYRRVSLNAPVRDELILEMYEKAKLLPLRKPRSR